MRGFSDAMRLFKYSLFAAALLALYSARLHAQETPANENKADEKIEERIENIAVTADENTDFTEIADQLKYYLEHPIDLNRTSREELLELGLLSEQQAAAMLNHITAHGKLIALQELQSVEGFDLQTIYSILPYVKIGNSFSLGRNSLNRILKEGQHTLILRTQRVLEEQKGFQPIPEGSTSQSYYLGDPWKIYARYRFTFQRKLSIGVTAEKDQGEEFFKGSQSSFDFYSYHLFYRNQGFLKTVALGDYQVAYGQGLTVWSGLAFGKSPEVVNIRKNALGILPYTSVNETFFRRGAAVSVGGKKLVLDVFASIRKMDGNLTDTIEQVEYFSSFQETGYHRSPNELADKNSIKENFYGGHLQFNHQSLKLGFTAIHSEFNKSFSPSPSVYNQFYFNGDKLTNTGFDYSYLFRNISVFGEVARSDNDAVAYLNGALISLDPKVSFAVLNRHYPRNYHSLYSNPLRESSSVLNENGTYFGLQVKPFRQFVLSAYYDAFEFPWLRYLVHSPTNGFEYLVQAAYIPNKKVSMYFRFRETMKPENASGDLTPIDATVNRSQKNYRYDIAAKISSGITLHSRIEFVTVNKEGEDKNNGLVMLQDVTFKPMGSRISFSARYALFDTDDYDSRIYAYENDVLYSYSIPSYYYKGARYYLTMRYQLKKGIDLWLRWAQTAYSNRTVVGSGYDEIEGSKKTEVKMQLRFVF